MKKAQIDMEIDPKDIVKGTNPEKHINVDIDVSDFEYDQAYLDIEEDLNEKTIKYIEKEVRSSYEYKKYIGYLKSELNLTKCALMPGIDSSTGMASIEFHHYPFTLYEIVEIIGKYEIDNLPEGQKVSCFDIANLTMAEHFRGNIGLVPLTTTMHKMAHNQAIIIPMSKINGNYRAFMNKYSNYIDPDKKDKIAEAELNSETDESKIYNATKLQKEVSDYNITYHEDETGGDNGEEI